MKLYEFIADESNPMEERIEATMFIEVNMLIGMPESERILNISEERQLQRINGITEYHHYRKQLHEKTMGIMELVFGTIAGEFDSVKESDPPSNTIH